ncbi:MAG: hypothetical protein BWY32_03224 [bacterium ADurb.Bin243]|nr:MAG: hypothetical protein BWY32_03224 [bacterium ADurb.Bin243]HOD39595.1 hypothetical protein [Candidatus Wallbacteria bacterium]
MINFRPFGTMQCAAKIKIYLSALALTAAIAVPAFADSTVTIPVPDTVANESKNLVLTITVPTSLEKTYQPVAQKAEEKPKKNNYGKYFDLNPFPNMVNNEEVAVLKRFVSKGVVEDISAVTVKRNFVANNYEMGRSLASIVNTALKSSPDQLARVGITRTDILDLLKVFDNYTKELKMFNVGMKDRERLSKLSNKLSFTDGEVKVIKVETNDIGSTVIHLTLNDQKGKYKPQYLSKLEPLPPAAEAQAPASADGKSEANLSPDSLQFSTSAKPPEKNPDGGDSTNPAPDPHTNNNANNGSNTELPPPPDVPLPPPGGDPAPDLPPPPPMD